jgi:hypothetical protein
LNPKLRAPRKRAPAANVPRARFTPNRIVRKFAAIAGADLRSRVR